MQIKSRLAHANINVTNIEQSIKFYEEALGLAVVGRKVDDEGAYELVYLGDGQQGVTLELTHLTDHPQPYELGENESHICFRVAGDYDAIREYHREKGWICYENHEMGLYFINDPDDYWIEVLSVDYK